MRGIVIPEKSVLSFLKDKFYPVSDFEITDNFLLNKKIRRKIPQ